MDPRRWSRQTATMMAGMVALAATAAAQLPAVVNARVDIDGTKEGIALLAVSPPAGGTATPATWYTGENEAKNRQYLCFHAPAHATEWRQVSFSFMPLQSGSVRLCLRGPWYKPAEEVVKVWIMFDDVAVQNSVVKNGGFEEQTAGAPAPWILGKRDGFLAVQHIDPSRARTGKGCIEVCHDLDGWQTIPVTANQTVTVTVWYRRGE